MGGSGGGGSSTTVQKADPWKGVQPYLTDLFKQAQQWQQGGTPQFFPGSTVTPFAPETEAGLQGITMRALQGSPLVGGAQQEAMRTLSGQYLGAAPATPGQQFTAAGGFLGANPAMGGFAQQYGLGPVAGTDYFQRAAGGEFVGENPYLQQTFESAARPLTQQFEQATMPSIASMFSAGGRYGSEAMQSMMGRQQEALGRSLGDLATGIYGPAYQQERAMQQQAAGQLGQMGLAERGLQQQALGGLGGIFGQERGLQQQAMQSLNEQFARERLNQLGAMQGAPGMAEGDYSDLARLLGVGQAREQQTAQQIAEDMARYDFGQQRDLEKLQQYASLLQGGLGFGQTSSAQRLGSNPLGSALGAGMMGSSLLPMLGSSGMLGSTAAASGMMGGAGINALGGLGLGPMGFLGGALLGGLFS